MNNSTKLAFALLAVLALGVVSYYTFLAGDAAPRPDALAAARNAQPDAAGPGAGSPLGSPTADSPIPMLNSADAHARGQAPAPTGPALPAVGAATPPGDARASAAGSPTDGTGAGPGAGAGTAAPVVMGGAAALGDPSPATPTDVAPVRVAAAPPVAGTSNSATPAVSQPRTHTVKGGETLSAIARAYYGRAGLWTEIAKANPLVDPNRLPVGVVLKLPDIRRADNPAVARPVEAPATQPVAGGTVLHTVKAGEGLWNLAEFYYKDGRKWSLIYEANKQTIGPSPDRVREGMKLRIPPAPAR